MQLPFHQRARSTTEGFSLIEVLLATTLFALVITALIGGLVYGTQSTGIAGDAARALLLAEEGIEAARSIRNGGFASLAAGQHGIATQGTWGLSGNQDTTGTFTRQIVVTDESSNRKKVVSTVTWPQTAQRSGSVSVATYLTSWADTQPPAQASWQYPAQEDRVDLDGGQSGLRVSYRSYANQDDYAFLITNSASNNFNIIDLSTVFGPALHASINLSNGPTDLEIIEAAIPYALVSSRDNSAEFQMVNIEYPDQPRLDYSLGLAGPSDGLTVTSTKDSGGKITAYLGRAASSDDNFHVIHIVDPEVGPPAPEELGSLKLDGDIRAIAFHPAFPTIALVASSDDNRELQMVDVSDKNNPRLISSTNLNGTADLLSLAPYIVSGQARALTGENYLLVGQADGLLWDFAIFNGPPNNDGDTTRLSYVRGGYNAGGAINDIAIKPDQTLVFLATAADSATQFEFQVITALNSPLPFEEYGSLQLPGVANDIFYVPQLDRNLIANESNVNEFIILKPGCQVPC